MNVIEISVNSKIDQPQIDFCYPDHGEIKKGRVSDPWFGGGESVEEQY